jgi:hypothetical protein
LEQHIEISPGKEPVIPYDRLRRSVGDAREVRVGGVEQDVVFAALSDEGWNQQDGGAGFDKPTVAECLADGLIRRVPTGEIGGGETFHGETGGNLDGEDAVGAGQTVEVGVD